MKLIVTIFAVLSLVYGISVENGEVTSSFSSSSNYTIVPDSYEIDSSMNLLSDFLGSNSETMESDGKIESRIFGGQPARTEQFPWQALLTIKLKAHTVSSHSWYNIFFPRKSNKVFSCGASLITAEHLVTAAHCLSTYDHKSREPFLFYEIRVKLGVTTKGRSMNFFTRMANIHPEWDESGPSFKNDIAVIRLRTKIKLGYVYPINLPSGNDNYVGKYAIASGFGKTEREERPDHLNFVQMKIISNNECKRNARFGIAIEHSYICTSSIDNKGNPIGTCDGDSGGPLVVNGTYTKQGRQFNGPILVGVTSFGSKDCSKGPSVYMRITYFMPFIKKYVPDV